MDKKRTIVIIAVALSIFMILFIFGIIQLLNVKRRVKMTPERMETIFEYGKRNYKDKDFEKAKRAFELILKEKNTNIYGLDSLQLMANMYEEQNDLIKAKQYYKRIIENFPEQDNIADIQRRIEEMNMHVLFSPAITEDSISYQIKLNDTLGAIAKKYNTTVELLKKSNGLKSDIILPGRFLKVNKAAFTILVDKSQNILFLKKNGEIMKTYRVSTGENNSTPEGTFKLEEKLISPLWYKVGAVVPPDNEGYELGTRWMGLSVEGYGIHGTKDPKSIGRQITRGCVRMMNNEVEELYSIVPTGTEVTIIE